MQNIFWSDIFPCWVSKWLSMILYVLHNCSQILCFLFSLRCSLRIYLKTASICFVLALAHSSIDIESICWQGKNDFISDCKKGFSITCNTFFTNLLWHYLGDSKGWKNLYFLNFFLGWKLLSWHVPLIVIMCHGISMENSQPTTGNQSKGLHYYVNALTTKTNCHYLVQSILCTLTTITSIMFKSCRTYAQSAAKTSSSLFGKKHWVYWCRVHKRK